jgi:DNA-binding transcriptional MerR regulator
VLQQILYYKELEFPLKEIKKILLLIRQLNIALKRRLLLAKPALVIASIMQHLIGGAISPNFNREQAFENHLVQLYKKQERLDALIQNITKSIAALKGEATMEDSEKFEGFKQMLIDENERKYGKEIRQKYGDKTVARSYAKVKGMSPEQHTEIELLSQEVNETLKAAFEQGDPSSKLAQKACELHKKWLCYFWDGYSKEAHIGVAQMYVDDPRFTEYYDKIAEGCAVFLRDAVLVYCK